MLASCVLTVLELNWYERFRYGKKYQTLTSSTQLRNMSFRVIREIKQPGRLRLSKTSHKNKHLRNGDHFAVIAFCSHSILLTNYAKHGLVGAPYK